MYILVCSPRFSFKVCHENEAGTKRTIHEALLLLQHRDGVPSSLWVVRIRRESLLVNRGPRMLGLLPGLGVVVLLCWSWLGKGFNDRIRSYHTTHAHMLIS